jgi:hypothetical protein
LNPEVNVFGKIDQFLEEAPLQVLSLFRPWWNDVLTEEQLRGTLSRIAGMIMDFPAWFDIGLTDYVKWAQRWAVAVQSFFEHDRFPGFLAEVGDRSEHELATFLWFLGSCSLNREEENEFDDAKAFGQELMRVESRNVLLDFVLGPLGLRNVKIVKYACQAVASIVLSSETVAFCLAKGYWETLVGLLEEFDDFDTKAFIVAAICRLVAESDVDQASALIARGFVDILDVYMEGVLDHIPRDLLDALQTCERYAEIAHKEEWYDVVFTPKIMGLLHQMETDRFPARSGGSMTVGMLARALIDRVEDS